MVRRFALPLVVLAAALVGLFMMNASVAIPVDNDDGSPAADTAVVSALRSPDWLRDPTADSLLADRAGDLLKDQAPTDRSCVAISRNGDVVIERDEHSGLYAGDLHRLVTAAALDEVALGFAYRTTISISRDAEIVVDQDTGEATLNGNVWLVGSGDPSLATADYADRYDNQRTFTSFEALAEAAIAELASQNITTINGRVVGDESKYSPVQRTYVGERVTVNGTAQPVWTASQDDGQIGPLSALMLNDGFTEFSPAGQPIDAAANVAASNPASAAASALDELLEDAGITVAADAVSGIAPLATEQDTLAVVESAALNVIIEDAVTDSTTAEMLLREFGIRSGSTSERARAAATLVSSAPAFAFGDDERVTAVDGSGRSLANRTSCGLLHDLVDDERDFIVGVMPQSAPCGVDVDQFRFVSFVDGSVSAMLGWHTAANGDRLTFAAIVDDPDRTDSELGPFQTCDDFQMSLLSVFDGYPLGPSVAAVSASGRAE